MRYRGTATVLLAAVGATAALVGCGAGSHGAASTSASPARPVDDDQALVLAQVLEGNWEHRGAVLTGTFEVRKVPVRMRARVDFRSGRGTMLIRESQADVPPRRITWTRKRVFAQSAPGSGRYVEQTPDPAHDPVHLVVAFVNLLSAETIDNTANIRDQGAVYVGPSSLGETPVDVYRYGPSGETTYWVGRRDGLLHKVEARPGESGRVSLSFRSRGAQRITLPRAARAKAAGR